MEKHVVITGVSRGLGRALAEALIAEGHRVSGCARKAEAVAALAHQYPDHHWTAVDIGHAAAVQTWAETILAQVGVARFCGEQCGPSQRACAPVAGSGGGL